MTDAGRTGIAAGGRDGGGRLDGSVVMMVACDGGGGDFGDAKVKGLTEIERSGCLVATDQVPLIDVFKGTDGDFYG